MNCDEVKKFYRDTPLSDTLSIIKAVMVLDIRGKTALTEAQVYGSGITMFLLSQGSWVKVIAPEDFVAEFRAELAGMCRSYIDM